MSERTRVLIVIVMIPVSVYAVAVYHHHKFWSSLPWPVGKYEEMSFWERNIP